MALGDPCKVCIQTDKNRFVGFGYSSNEWVWAVGGDPFSQVDHLVAMLLERSTGGVWNALVYKHPQDRCFHQLSRYAAA